ncbi:hypothetical protein L596_009604 [Steinernema carpocapsae]|uniref:Uncharacterized protein n=1 Tax=Steinernema carpocapsae TaxID=34508 RepID=A0A4U5PH53_STECR|nr:hypothetical protein L596_009604 [Steinernema carpocapsae]
MSSSNPIDSSQQMESQPIPMDIEEVPEAKPVRMVSRQNIFDNRHEFWSHLRKLTFGPNFSFRSMSGQPLLSQRG